MNYDLRDVHFTPGWGRVHETLYEGGSAAVLAVYEAKDYIVAQPFLMRDRPTDTTSMGFGGPLSNDPIPSRSHGEAARMAFIEWHHEIGALSEFTLFNPLFEAEQYYLSANHAASLEKRVAILPTSKPIEPTHGRVSDRASAVEAGVQVNWEVGGSLDWFATQYCAQMQRIGAAKRWQLSLAYFAAIEAHCRNAHTAHYALAKALMPDGACAAAALFLLSPSAMYYHLSIDGGERVRGATDTLIWAAHRIAKENGYPWLYLGGGVTGRPEDGLLRYKQSFGGLDVPIYSSRQIHNRPAYLSACDVTGVNSSGGGFFPAYRIKESQR